MNQNKKDIFKEIIRFLLVGGFATICDYVVYFLFSNIILKEINVTLNLIISGALGFTTGLFINWFLQSFVFKYLDKDVVKKNSVFVKYLIVSLLGLGVTELGILLAKPIYGKMFVLGLDFWKLFIKCIMTCIVLAMNYLGRKFYVFKEKK